jgi:hypothetical protein
MAAIPPRDTQTVAALYAAIAAADDGKPRAYLGMSEIGRPCDRALWLRFRWATTPEHDGRVLRLFRRGNLEEVQMANDLRLVGIRVETQGEDGRQFGFQDIGGHFRGHMDGAVLGVLEAPKTWHVWECKTASKSQWDKLRKAGVQGAKPEHWAQMQLYMHYSGMERAFYTAVCKDDDQIYAERIHYSQEDATQLIARARRIIRSEEPPEKIGDADHDACKWCEHRGICHNGIIAKQTCRTCRRAEAVLEGDDGAWFCQEHHAPLGYAEQLEGCLEYQAIEGLPVDGLLNAVFEKIGGKVLANRAPPDGGFFNDPVPF